MILQIILLFHTSSDPTSYCKIYFTLMQNMQVITNSTVHLYLHESTISNISTQIDLHTSGTAFSLGYLIKIRQRNKQTGKQLWVLEIKVTAVVS